MTPAERAVIDAARAYVAYYWGADAPPTSAAGAALYAAVRALPRPLSEQLAELRVGDSVETGEGVGRYRWPVVMNLPKYSAVCVEEDGYPRIIPHDAITRIISNPEVANG